MKLFALSSSARLCVVPWMSIKIYRPPNTGSSETRDSRRYKWKWNSHRIDFQPEKAFWLHDDFMEIYPFLQSVGCQLKQCHVESRSSKTQFCMFASDFQKLKINWTLLIRITSTHRTYISPSSISQNILVSGKLFILVGKFAELQCWNDDE